MVTNLIKIARAVDGDDWFVERVKVACRLANKEVTDHLLVTVAAAVEADIKIDADMAVDCKDVDDVDIIEAVNKYKAPEEVVK